MRVPIAEEHARAHYHPHLQLLGKSHVIGVRHIRGNPTDLPEGIKVHDPKPEALLFAELFEQKREWPSLVYPEVGWRDTLVTAR